MTAIYVSSWVDVTSATGTGTSVPIGSALNAVLPGVGRGIIAIQQGSRLRFVGYDSP